MVLFAKGRDEALERAEITALLEGERLAIEGALRIQGDRNKVYRSQGIPAPHPEVCDVCLDQGKRNIGALAEAISYKPQGVERVKRWLGDERSHDLIDKLLKLEHAYRSHEREGEPGDAILLGPLQRVRTYLFLEELEQGGLVQEIGEIVEKNPVDGKTELGGFVIPDAVRMRLGLYEVSSPSHRSYSWKVRDLNSVPHIGLFHLHALNEDCSAYAGPSFSEAESDMSTAQSHASHLGESHNFVISRLSGRAFNIDYYTFQRRAVRGKIVEDVACVDLGNYDY